MTDKKPPDYTEEAVPFDDVLRKILKAKPKPKKAVKPSAKRKPKV